MLPRILQIAVAALVLILCRAGADEGYAKVVRDGRAGLGNPPVEAGGHHLPKNEPSPPIPYSLIGAIDNGGNSCTPSVAWRQQWLGAFGIHRHAFFRRSRAPWFGFRRVNFSRFR
jgi:hypothetical protein